MPHALMEVTVDRHSKLTAPQTTHMLHSQQEQQQQQHDMSQPAYSATALAAAGVPQHHSHTQHLDYTSQPHGRKRSRNGRDLHLDLQSLAGMQNPISDPTSADMSVDLTPHGHHPQPASLYSSQRPQSTGLHHPHHVQQPPQHHHHRLPNQPPPAKIRRHTMSGYSPGSPPSHSQHGPPSMVGQEGMPDPAPRPRGPKLKFTPEDDAKLVELKEKKNLTWKQISEFFPGRSSGTLQVRYCTKLKAKTTVWTPETVSSPPARSVGGRTLTQGIQVLKLRNAMQEYENDRWRVISSKLGSGFSPAACKEKADEIRAIEGEAVADTSGDVEHSGDEGGEGDEGGGEGEGDGDGSADPDQGDTSS